MRKFFTHSTKGTKYGQQLRLSIKQANLKRLVLTFCSSVASADESPSWQPVGLKYWMAAGVYSYRL